MEEDSKYEEAHGSGQDPGGCMQRPRGNRPAGQTVKAKSQPGKYPEPKWRFLFPLLVWKKPRFHDPHQSISSMQSKIDGCGRVIPLLVVGCKRNQDQKGNAFVRIDEPF